MINFYKIISFWFCLSVPVNFNAFGQCPPGPTTQPTAIGGTNPVCPGSVVVYSTTVGTDAASTTWSVPGGWTINSTTLTTVTTTAGAASGNVCVYAWSAGCGNSATTCAFITANSNSTDPTGVSISTNPICSGNSTTLTVSGGSLGTGANWQWYTGSCGSTNVGTGSSIAVSPGSTTQYWVRAEGTCNNTSCATNTVTVNINSSAAASVSAAPNPICVGSSTTLSLAGGLLGTGASWQWYSTACGGTLVGSGASLVLFPASTTTYFARAEGTCNTTSCPAGVMVTVNTLSTAAGSISATANPVCNGSSTTLTPSGGSLGSGASWNWYTGSCGGTLVGTGNSLAVSPSSATTYYLSAEGTCNTTACVNLIINVTAQPSANAGSDGNECVLTHVLSATPSIGTGTWTQAGGTGATSYSNANDPNATATATAYGTYTYTWTEDNSGCISSDNVVVTYYQQPVSFAGNDATVCGALFTNFTAVPSAGTGTWTQDSGPGVSGYSNPNASNATVTVSTWGVYTYSWTENNGGCTSSDQVVISFYQQPVANAGASTDQCDLDFTFNATPSVGTGTWTKVVGPGSASYSNVNDPNATVTVNLYGSYLFRWTEVEIGCSDFDDVTVNFFEQPVADGGPDAIICGLNYNMQAVYSAGTGLWTFVNGPGSSSFSNPNSVNTNVTVSAIGVYTYEWFCDNNGCQDRDTVALNFTSPTPPVANAGADDSYCGLSYTLAAVPSLGTGTWTQVLGTGTSSYSNVNDPNAIVTVNNYGLYVFRWTEVNGNCSDDDDITVNFNMIPVADAGFDDSSCTMSYKFNASATTGIQTWSQLTGPGSSSFSNPNSTVAKVTVTATGVYTYEWTVNNNGCVSSDTIIIYFGSQPAADAGIGGNECDMDYIFSAVPSTGTGTWMQVSGPGSSSFSNVNDPVSTATATIYGNYIYRWTEVNGTCSSEDDVTVNYFSPPLADAGPGDSLCAVSYTFNASSSTGTGTWSQLSGPGLSSFLNVNSPATTVTVSVVGIYYYEWAVNNNGCVSSDTIRIKFNDPPTAYAGTDANECDMDVVLAASIGPGTGTWTQQSGPGTATFSDVNNPNDTVAVSMYGTYSFRWTKLVGVCTVYDEVTVNFFSSPLADAGADNTICLLNYSFNASSSTGSGSWSQAGGIGVSSFTNVNSPTSTVSVSTTGIYTFEWSVNNNGCVSLDTVIINFSAPPIADAGTGGNECDLDYIFSAVPSVGTGTWTQVSGPGSSSFSNAGDPAATITASAFGIYVYRWTEVSGTCSSYDDVNVNFFMPPLADAGNDNSSCSLDYSFNASTSTGTGTWSQISGTGVSSFSNPGSPTATVTVSTTGIYIYEWAVNNNGCLSSDTITITFSPPPTANAGADATDCGLDITLNAIPSTGIGTWTQYFGPGTSSFSNINDPNATVNVTLYGTYIFRWTEVSGSCNGVDDVTVNFFMPPAVSAGTDQNICGSQYFLSASSSTGTGTWSQLSGTGTAAFSNINNPSTTVTVSLIGNYQLEWSANNNGCVSADTINLAFDNPLLTDAGSDGKECNLDFVFSAISSTGTGLWTMVLGPGIAVFADSTDPATTVTVSSYGTYIFQWKENNGICSDSDLVTIDFFNGPSPSAGSDGTTCGLSWSLNAVPSTGTGIWSQVLGTGVGGFAMPANPATAVSVSQFGSYIFRWTETNGTCTAYDDVTVTFFEPTSAYAGAGGNACDSVFNLVATATGGNGLWSQQSGGGTASFSAVNSPATAATVSEYGTYVFRWTETNGICVSFDTVIVNYYQKPVAFAGPGGKECDKDYIFSAMPSAGIGTWSMIIGNGTSAFTDANSPVTSVAVSNTGTYIFRWTEVNGICSDYEDAVVNFYPQPFAGAGNDTVISLGNSAMLNGTGGDYYSWSPDSTLDNPNIANPIASPKQTALYRLIVTTIYGCTDTDEVSIAVVKDFNFGVSEVITPNDDGYNEKWKIDNIEFYTDCDVSIYNRYGNVVFEKKNYQNDWNGKYNGKPLPDGTYYYVITCAGSDDKWTGPLTILK